MFLSLNMKIAVPVFLVMRAVLEWSLFSHYFQAYKAALESLGHSEYALKAGFHLNPKSVEAALQVGLVWKMDMQLLWNLEKCRPSGELKFEE